MQVILEGMGRAIHTNFNAQFKCDALKVTFTGFVSHYLEFELKKKKELSNN